MTWLGGTQAHSGKLPEAQMFVGRRSTDTRERLKTLKLWGAANHTNIFKKTRSDLHSHMCIMSQKNGWKVLFFFFKWACCRIDRDLWSHSSTAAEQDFILRACVTPVKQVGLVMCLKLSTAWKSRLWLWARVLTTQVILAAFPACGSVHWAQRPPSWWDNRVQSKATISEDQSDQFIRENHKAK